MDSRGHWHDPSEFLKDFKEREKGELMDSRGHWHDPSEFLKDFKERERRNDDKPETNHRAVIEIGIGEMVQIVHGSGQTILARFDAANKNRVTLTPQNDGTPRPYLQLADRVQIQRSTGESVVAQVWDHRNGKIILRTLPVGG